MAAIADPGLSIKNRPFQAFETDGGELAQLKADPAVASVEPDVTYATFADVECTSYPVCAKPNDSFFRYEWHLNNDSTSSTPSNTMFDPASRADILAPQGWGLASATPARVAIADTGIAPSHPDVTSAVTYSKSEVGGTTDDNAGHGTEVAGTIGAIPGNGTGVAGVAPGARLSMFKVSDSGSAIACSAVTAAIVDAIGRADVINLSLGGPSPCTAMRDAIATAKAADVLVVASAGNDGGTAPNYPAAFPDALSVAATDPSDELSSFSSRGSTVDIAAPGSDILTTTNDNYYAFVSGTSFSAPIVAGVAGMLYPLLTDTNGNGQKMDEVRARLTSTSDVIPATGAGVTAGRVNLCRALGGDSARCGAATSSGSGAAAPLTASPGAMPPPAAAAPTTAPPAGAPTTAPPAGAPTTAPSAPATPATVYVRRSLVRALKTRYGTKMKRLRIKKSKVTFTRLGSSYRGTAARASRGRWKVKLVVRKGRSKSTRSYTVYVR